MIQRIQTLYLLIVAALMAVILFVPALTRPLLFSLLTGHTALIALTVLLPLTTIFLFKKRGLQMWSCTAEIVLLAAILLFWGFVFGNNYVASALDTESTIYFIITGGLLLAGIVFTWLARRAIRRDEALIRSIDRIR